MCASRSFTERSSQYFFSGDWEIGFSSEGARCLFAWPPQASELTAEELPAGESSLKSTPQKRGAGVLKLDPHLREWTMSLQFFSSHFLT
jgi:hypothetical protein